MILPNGGKRFTFSPRVRDGVREMRVRFRRRLRFELLQRDCSNLIRPDRPSRTDGHKLAAADVLQLDRRPLPAGNEPVGACQAGDLRRSLGNVNANRGRCG